MRNRSPAKIAASSPPVPARTSRNRFASSRGSLGSSRICSSSIERQQARFQSPDIVLRHIAHFGIVEHCPRLSRVRARPDRARAATPSPARAARIRATARESGCCRRARRAAPATGRSPDGARRVDSSLRRIDGVMGSGEWVEVRTSKGANAVTRRISASSSFRTRLRPLPIVRPGRRGGPPHAAVPCRHSTRHRADGRWDDAAACW